MSLKEARTNITMDVEIVCQDGKSNESGAVLGIILSIENLRLMDEELSKCAINRLVNGKTDHFHEKLFHRFRNI